MKDPEQAPVETRQRGKKKVYRAAMRKSEKRSQTRGGRSKGRRY